MINKRSLLLAIAVGFVCIMSAQIKQPYFRKCYIIAYESNNDFSKAERQSCIRQTLEKWFNNKKTECTPDDSKGTIPSDFFNPKEDEILFFNFGLYSDSYHYNVSYPSLSDSIAFFKFFTDNFLRFQSRYSLAKGNVDYFLNNCFDNCYKSIKTRGAYNSSGEHYRQKHKGSASLSNYVFPLLFTKFPTGINAKEYYVLQISDFDNLLQKGSARDNDQLRDVMGSAAPFLRKNLIDPLEDHLGRKTTFFHSYSVGTKKVSIYCYTPEEIPCPTSKDIKFKQIKYGEDNYLQDVVNIEFRHDKQLVIKMLYEDVFAIKDSQTSLVLHRKIDPLPLPVTQKDENIKLYTIDENRVKLSPAVKYRNFDKLIANYTFYTQQHLLDVLDCNLGYIRFASDDILLREVQFSDPTSAIILNWFWRILPFVILMGLILLAIAICRGRVKDFKMEIKGFTDKFREMKNCEITEHAYTNWNQNRRSVSLTVNIVPEYCKGLKIKWGEKLSVKSAVENLNNSGLTAKISNDDGSGKMDINTVFEPQKHSGKYEYTIRIEQPANVPALDFSKNKYVFDLITNLEATHSFLGQNLSFISSFKRNNINPYQFEIGKDLGKIWVAFDPGTTASSVAFGNDSRSIHFSQIEMEKYNEKVLSKINSSMIAFENKVSQASYFEWLPDTDYWYGVEAERKVRLKSRFRSMKKTLGYNTTFPIEIDEKKEFELDGQKIFALLVRGLYKDLDDYVKSDKTENGYLTNGDRIELDINGKSFKPKRAVVVIPNCFTLQRTQAMIDSIAMLGKFDEIISTYEAEAVLYYCIKKDIVQTSGRVLIFDMGGATINTSFFNFFKNEKYEIDTLGRIGYGIGGDTIDFCIINAILSMPSIQEAFGVENTPKKIKAFRDNNAKNLLDLAFKIKEDIVKNFNIANNYLITANNLRVWIKDSIDLDINITEDLTDFENLFKRRNDSYPLFDLFIEPIVYKNVRDAITELTAFKEVTQIKSFPVTLILSGRSTAFPFVEKTVIDALNTNGFTNIDFKNLQKEQNLDDLKTVVAEGACWYGLNRTNVMLNNAKCFYSFVVKKSKSSSDKDVGFIPLIKCGLKFEKNINNGKMEIRIVEEVNSTFANEGNNNCADIYQVTGNSPKKLYKVEGMKHKITKIASLSANPEIKKIELVLHPDDSLDCTAKYDSNSRNDRTVKANTLSLDIANENDEHYIFAVKHNG